MHRPDAVGIRRVAGDAAALIDLLTPLGVTWCGIAGGLSGGRRQGDRRREKEETFHRFSHAWEKSGSAAPSGSADPPRYGGLWGRARRNRVFGARPLGLTRRSAHYAPKLSAFSGSACFSAEASTVQCMASSAARRPA